MEVLDVEAVLRQRIAQTSMGRVHALQTTGFASERAALEPLCMEAPEQTDTWTHSGQGLTLQQPHEEPGGGHKNQMG